jgi:hypothetical protein
MSFQNKYLKYKNKYLNLKKYIYLQELKLIGGSNSVFEKKNNWCDKFNIPSSLCTRLLIEPSITEIKIGNAYYIYGHPEYNKDWGKNLGKYVICVDIKDGIHLFMRFTCNGSFKPQTFLEIQDDLAKGFVDDMYNHIKINNREIYNNLFNPELMGKYYDDAKIQIKKNKPNIILIYQVKEK